MLLCDVNLLVFANRRDSPRHHEYRSWLEERLDGLEPVGISDYVLSSFMEIITSPGVYEDPTPVGDAIDFCDAVLAAPAAVPVRPGARHWPLFTELCLKSEAAGSLVPDVYVAALALEQGATLVAAHPGHPSFPGLRVVTPFDAKGSGPTRR